MATDSSPRPATPLVWLLGLFAFGTAALLGLQKPPDQSQASKPPAESAKEEKKSEPPGEPGTSEPLLVLREHLQVEPEGAGETSGLTLQLKKQADDSSFEMSIKKTVRRTPGLKSADLKRYPAEYEFLIATVPDPVESKFPHDFDAVLDGIQRAYEARSFILRASRLPWPRGRAPGEATTNSKSTLLHREYPGVLLFQKSRNPENPNDRNSENPNFNRSFALVCLVGESPISGIQKPALYRALDARQDLDRVIKGVCPKKASIGWADSSKDQIRIVAPYFSGSQSSLIHTLKEWRKKTCQKVCFRIISGGATALNPALFRDAKIPCPKTTVIPNELVTRGVLSYLAGQRGLSIKHDEHGRSDIRIGERVAILREANTVFGAQVSYSLREGLEHSQDNNSQDKAFKRLFFAQPVIFFPFPMSISQLHAEQERNARVALPPTGFVEPRLPIRGQTQFDAIPPYDPDSAKTTAGESLRMILTTIERAQVRYVGIVATDMRDVVYLNKQIRKECPHVRVFTTEPSIALLHPEEAYHLRGMVVGSTYPLAPIAQSWSRTKSSPHQMISFPTQQSQGYYNAVLAQCKGSDQWEGSEQCEGSDLNLMLGYHPPPIPSIPCAKPLNRPPIWISVVGQGGRLVPVHCYTEYPDGLPGSGNCKENPPVMIVAPGKPELEKPIVGIPVGILLGSLGSVLALAAVILALTNSWVWKKGAARLTAAEFKAYRLGTSVWVWVWRAVILAGILLFTLPHTLPAREAVNACCGAPPGEGGWRHWFVFGTAFFLHVELFAVLMLLLLRVWSPFGPGADPRLTAHARRSRYGYAVLAALVLAAWLLTLLWWAMKEPAERFFLYVRATDLTAGLSPLVPMGLLGAAAVALGWFSLRQMDLARRRWLPSPYRNPWANVQSADEELRKNLGNPIQFLKPNRFLFQFDTLSATLGILGLCILFLLWFSWNEFIIFLPSGEGWWWDLMMRLLFWVMAGAVVLTLARFLVLWSRLKELLQEIRRVPMVAAFERLPHEIGRLFGGYLYSERPHRRHLAAMAWALPPATRDELRKIIDQESMENKLDLQWVFGTPAVLPDPHQSEEEKECRPLRSRYWLVGRLGKYAREFLTQLSGEWMGQTVDEAYGDGVKKGITGKGSSPPSQVEVEPILQTWLRKPSITEKEDYVAAFIVLYLGNYFAQLRMLVYAMATAAPLLLFAAASYPFQPDHPRLAALVGMLLAVAVGVTYVLFRINKDGLISRITRTTPDRFTPDTGFLWSMMAYVVPLVTFAVLQVLGLFRFVVEPILGLFG